VAGGGEESWWNGGVGRGGRELNRPERQEMWRRNVALARVTDVAQTVEGATQLQLVITLVAGGREPKFWGGVAGLKKAEPVRQPRENSGCRQGSDGLTLRGLLQAGRPGFCRRIAGKRFRGSQFVAWAGGRRRGVALRMGNNLAGALDKISEKAHCLPPGPLQLVCGRGEEEMRGRKVRRGVAQASGPGMRSVEYVWGWEVSGYGGGVGESDSGWRFMEETREKGRTWENGAGSCVYGGGSDDGIGLKRLAAMGVEPGLGIAVVATLIQRTGW
jgi:hypothetical protein